MSEYKSSGSINDDSLSDFGQFMELSHVVIKQEFSKLEAFTGWDVKNRYECTDPQGKLLFKIEEESELCERICCQSYRELTFHVSVGGKEVLTLYRPRDCEAICGVMATMEVNTPKDDKIGTVSQEWSWWNPKFVVDDENDNPMMHIDANACDCSGPMKCCGDRYVMAFSDSETGEEMGEVAKVWGWQEMFNSAETFEVVFPAKANLQQRVLMFAATFLLDMVLFEVKQNDN